MSNKTAAIVRWCAGYYPGQRLHDELGYDLITGVKHLTETGKKMHQRDVVFNFGCSLLGPQTAGNPGRLINPGRAISNAVHKAKSFALFDKAGLPTVYWTDDWRVAEEWYNDGDVLFCRETDSGLGGMGIEIASEQDNAAMDTTCQLYTVWTGENVTEYRAHVFDKRVIVRQQKKRMGSEKLAREKLSEPHKYIRVQRRGWVFAEHDVSWKRDFDRLCVQAVDALGLDFGTVDFQARGSERWLLEINTAPGMENRNTFEQYCRAMRRVVG